MRRRESRILEKLLAQLHNEHVIQSFSHSDVHVMYEGGQIHSDFAFNINKLLSAPELVRQSVRGLASRVPDLESANLICSYLSYGDELAAAAGAMLQREALTLNTSTGSWCPKAPGAGMKCLVIADDILTGGRLEKLVKSILSCGASVMEPVLVLANLSTDWSPSFSVSSLVKRNIPLWKAEDCPLCKAGSLPPP